MADCYQPCTIRWFLAMAHRFMVTKGAMPSAPTVLMIYTDNNGMIEEIAPPPYRAGDAVIKQMLTEWRAYADAAIAGSPTELETMTLFRSFLGVTYGENTYMVVQRY